MPWTTAVSMVTTPITKTFGKAVSMLPVLPWYVWAGVASGLLILLGSRVAGAATAPALPGRPSGAPPLLKMGSTGPWVIYLQGLLGVPQTGTFDQATDKAVRDYQTANAPPADGLVGGGTWTALGVTGSAPPSGGGGGPSPQPQPQPQPQPGPSTPPAPTVGNPFGLAPTIAEREGQILQYVADGAYHHEWQPLDYTTKDGHHVHLEVSRRAFALSNGPGTRTTINVSMRTAQKIADMIGGSIPTTRILDEVWKAAGSGGTRLGVLNKSWNTDNPVTGEHTDRMYEQSNDIAAHLAQKGDQGGFVANEGKDWALTRHFWDFPVGLGPTSAKGSIHNAANFGWYMAGSSSHSPGGEPVIQSIGTTHGLGFTDYSQLARFIRLGSLTIDGVPWDWGAALADPTVSAYIQDEGGTIPSPRHPDL
jgi:peptidoglycan hydrolase-like protein with peptidoglycan-binding domain